ncbi:MAG: GNAT family N-acetyltransferase [Planctomycetes bacterium]|nr:GNAT family N-acetyltransferase [Planctomycetota bacterium]
MKIPLKIPLDSPEPHVAICRVRHLRPSDLRRVVALDELITGRERRGYFEHKLQTNLLDSSVEVSLGAEVDGILVGFLLARVWTGEFGATEPVAVLDTLGVQPAFQHQGVGDALLDQLVTNLRGLAVYALRTEVAWDGFELLRFFHRHGFRPAPRVCLDLDLVPQASELER